MSILTVKAVILDFGGVLLHVGDVQKHVALAQELGIPVETLQKEIFDGPLSLAAQRGEISAAALWETLAQQWGLPPEKAEWLAARFWEGVRIDYDLVDWLRGLRPRYRTGLLSNAWDDLRDLLHKLGIADAFDAMVISAEEHLMKPDPAIYRIILERLDVAPAEAVFVDDRAENIRAARALGLRTVHYRRRDQVMAELRNMGVA